MTLPGGALGPRAGHFTNRSLALLIGKKRGRVSTLDFGKGEPLFNSHRNTPGMALGWGLHAGWAEEPGITTCASAMPTGASGVHRAAWSAGWRPFLLTQEAGEGLWLGKVRALPKSVSYHPYLERWPGALSTYCILALWWLSCSVALGLAILGRLQGRTSVLTIVLPWRGR